MKTAIVTTTINIPHVLLQYAANAKLFGHEDLEFIVIGDRRSPAETAEFCKRVDRQCRCRYLGIADQTGYLEKYPELAIHLPYDSIQRRNIGFLLAFESGAEVIISIDDDNYVMPQDFVRLHGIVGTRPVLPSFGSSSGFFDVCSFLAADDDARFYHRGYPQKQRWAEAQNFVVESRDERKVAINAGFWLDNPDMDALSRMERQPIVRGFSQRWKGQFTLQYGTWSPFNSQNTAIAREVIPAYFLSPYVGRYDDIWASYIVSRIAQHLHQAISFGEPLVRQQRNPHDLWKDLDAERNGMVLTDSFCAALRSIALTGSTYYDCFVEIHQQLGKAWELDRPWKNSEIAWKTGLIEGMEVWHKTFERASVAAGGAEQSRDATCADPMSAKESLNVSVSHPAF